MLGKAQSTSTVQGRYDVTLQLHTRPELDTTGLLTYGFATKIKLESKIPVEREENHMKKGLLLGLVFIFSSALAVQAQDVDVPGNLTMVDSTATAGNILKNGVLFVHNFGTNNTFIGSNAGNLTMAGSGNTASGVNALFSNTTGAHNTASGFTALQSNTTGSSNTASGVNALFGNTTGFANTASGTARSLATPQAAATPPVGPARSLEAPQPTPTPPAGSRRSLTTPQASLTPPVGTAGS